MIKALNHTHITTKTRTFVAIAAVITAVALPQVFHVLGRVFSLGTALGEALLPMHLPVMLAGLIAGPVFGTAAGLISPLISFLLSGMPTSAMLPFMAVELAIYGLVCGILVSNKIPTVLKVLAAQFFGRAVRAAVILAASALSLTKIPTSVILTSIVTGVAGIILQLILIPVIMRIINNKG